MTLRPSQVATLPLAFCFADCVEESLPWSLQSAQLQVPN